MCKLKQILNQIMLINLYYSLIYSNIVYCIQALGNAGVTDLNHIFILQKRSVRLLTDNPIMSNTPGVLQSSDPLLKKKRYLLTSNLYKFIFNYVNNNIITFKTGLN